jgi:hypothetical protein
LLGPDILLNTQFSNTINGRPSFINIKQATL